MTSTFDDTGLSVDSLVEILDTYDDRNKTAFGTGAKSDAQSVFGQVYQNVGLSASEQGELVEAVAQAFNIQTASGVALDNLVLLAGIQRTEDAYSTVTLTCGANAAGATIPAGSLVREPGSNVQWETDEQVVVGASSTNTVSATATVAGANAASAGTITQIDSPVYGWTTVTNAAAANLGATEESDAALRLRYLAVVDAASDVSVAALFQAISDLDGVDSVKVVANNTTTTDANGVPAQHVWCIVDGGTNSEIAQAIFEHTAAGIGYHGNTTVSHTDSVTGDTFSIKFERPVDQNVWVSVDLTSDSDYPADGDDQVEAAILAYFDTLQLGNDVIHSRLYTPINTIDGHTINSLYIDTSPSPTDTDDITIALNYRAVTTAGSISVTSTPA